VRGGWLERRAAGANPSSIPPTTITNILVLVASHRSSPHRSSPTALKNFDALFVVPIICALLLSGSVVLGGVCFNEFEVISSSEAGILGVSVGLCMVGVMGISYQPGEEVEKFKERTESMKFVGKGDVDDNQL